ncbi:MAG: hypothetical protein JWM96_436 [Alphaproteobacteria bacterium]|nr:hypothetical protein [Alphaproteobacteria bacterium]
MTISYYFSDFQRRLWQGEATEITSAVKTDIPQYSFDIYAGKDGKMIPVTEITHGVIGPQFYDAIMIKSVEEEEALEFITSVPMFDDKSCVHSLKAAEMLVERYQKGELTWEKSGVINAMTRHDLFNINCQSEETPQEPTDSIDYDDENLKDVTTGTVAQYKVSFCA